MIITMDCKNFDTIKQVYDYFNETLHFPDYFGYNLDALHDCLSELSEELTINLNHPEYLRMKLGFHFSNQFLRLLKDCDVTLREQHLD